MESHSEVPGLHHVCPQYGEHSLQRVGIWQYQVRDQPPASAAYWIIYIHGGAWRDPKRTLYDFVPSIKHLVSSKVVSSSSILGFASIDYRLSHHVDYPQDAASTPVNELRQARDPDHIRDVRSALSFLNTEYNIGHNYILLGHSAGGTLAHQVLMGGSTAGEMGPAVPFPSAIIGIAGIYDLGGLVSRFPPCYGFMSAAFGTDKEVWKLRSPAHFNENFKNIWANDSHLVILAASPEDSLVDMQEIDAMAAKHTKDGSNLIVIKDLVDDHDEIWGRGFQLPGLIATAVENLTRPN